MPSPKIPLVEGVEILSITKPMAKQPYACAWGCGYIIPTGRMYVRAVWKDRRQDKANPVINYDHICVECYTKD
jgi:hypothetical protein